MGSFISEPIKIVIANTNKNIHSLKKIGFESKKWSYIDIDQPDEYLLSKIIFEKYYKKDNKNFYV